MIELATNPLNLSDAQAAVVEAVARTYDNAEAAAELGMSPKAVGMTLVRACRAAGVKNRIHLLLEWDRVTRGGRAA